MMSGTQRPLLAVDIGNQQLKVGCFPAPGDDWPRPEKTWRLAASGDRFGELEQALPAEPSSWLVGSVERRAEAELRAWVAVRRPADEYRLLENSDLPIAIRVDAPEAVGADRVLAAVAVNRLRAPERAAVVVDAGSAITVDLVSADGAFEGGAILPGFRMVAKALFDGTDRLPLVDAAVPRIPPPPLGKSTVAAIQSGLYWGNVGAVRELVARLSLTLDRAPELFIAGGDAELLAHQLRAEARVVPDLVLTGIALTWSRLSRPGTAARLS